MSFESLGRDLRQVVEELVDEALRERLPALQKQPEGEYLTVDQAAAIAHVHPGSIYRWGRQGKLERKKVGTRVLYPREALICFIEKAGKQTPDAAVDAAMDRIMRRSR